MDTKATVNVGEYSRHGCSRGLEPVKAWDHDMRPKQKLVPGGILEPVSGRSFLFFTGSYKTSDFMADGLQLWWNEMKQDISNVKRLVINMDNGPECSGRRSQFLKRLVGFSDVTGLAVRIIYYPPYHSKYNGIERYWAGLEKSWNGYLLSTVSVVLNRAANFVWKRVRTTVHLLETTYEKGVKVCGKERERLEDRLERSEKLPWYDITIFPKTVYQYFDIPLEEQIKSLQSQIDVNKAGVAELRREKEQKMEDLKKQHLLYLSQPKQTIPRLLTEPKSSGQRRPLGRRGYEQLTDYLIPVIRLIKNGVKHTDAFHRIADKLGVRYHLSLSTANAQCTVQFGHISTEKFVELIESNKIKSFLKERFPDKASLIEKEI